ncbi:MAG TPA: hypothetical protein VJ799_09340 [Nitrososphaeraceae archaeon]|nr:hypothetical protein [Nitrososphaeraceae archaeon]
MEYDGKIFSLENKTINAIVLAALVVAIFITNIFVILSPNDSARFYNAGLTSTITIGVALLICLTQVYRYKRSIKIQLRSSKQSGSKQSVPSYYDNNIMHLSICLFLVLWFVAQFVWTFPYQQTAGVWIADIIWFIGYASFGYFLYSLYYHFFRKEHEQLVLILIAIVISTVLVLILDIIVSILRLLSTQPVDFSILLATLVYPILDAVLIFPAVLIFWGVRKRRAVQKSVRVQRKEQQIDETIRRRGEVSSLSHSLTNVSSIWILLLSVAMILSAIGDTGFAFSAAYGPDSVQRDVWIWNIIYNADHLCLAAALVGYASFFSFKKQDILLY